MGGADQPWRDAGRLTTIREDDTYTYGWPAQ